MAESPKFLLCVLPKDRVEAGSTLDWYLSDNSDCYDLGELDLGQQFEFAAELESFVSDWKDMQRHEGDV